ncbi:CPBP family intramembrane glutamic endopeptidase [Thermoactinomyces mirandus]|uniref:CPBP family intramembrane metalloprotease n=1 Tax=Thermoactinomyces mirandus TaxID=2756294 RepID=A0A7W2AS05_9BACL|nr:type II CAAX endopeptidase family protein [Thermoactinomyces mirandus]MBA4601941.1 CPBP family intramembrane metalloprotease [Thermoactinomyces mirandus]
MNRSFFILEQARLGEKKIHPVLVPVIALLFFFIGGMGVFFLSLFPVPSTLFMNCVLIHLKLTFSFGGTTLFVFAWVYLVEKRPVSTIGFTRKGALKKYIAGWIWGFSLISLPVLFLVITGFLTLDLGKINLSLILILLISFISFAVQGAAEEIVVRGWLLPVMAVRSPLWVAVVTSLLFFAVMHLLNNDITILSFFNIMLFGLFAIGHVLNEGSLWGICAIHSVWNWAQGSVYGFAISGQRLTEPLLKPTVHGPDLIHGGPFGIEGSIFTSIVLGIASWLVWRKALKAPKKSTTFPGHVA